MPLRVFFGADEVVTRVCGSQSQAATERSASG
jgi:hypothetical protein